MRWTNTPTWLTVGIILTGLSAGCRNAQTCSSNCTECQYVAAGCQTGTAGCSGITSPSAPCTNCQPAPAGRVTPGPMPTLPQTPKAPTAPKKDTSAATSSPVAMGIAHLPDNVSAKPRVDRELPDIRSEVVPQRPRVSTLVRDGSYRRRSFADITADPRFNHASDYSWLVGRLYFVHGRNEWRLRYNSVEEVDRYGGSVTLVTSNRLMKSFRDGQIVRVTGHLMQPDSRDPSPDYRVGDIQPAN